MSGDLIKLNWGSLDRLMGGYIEKVLDEATDHQFHPHYSLASIPLLLKVPDVHSEADVITGNQDHFGPRALMMRAPLDGRCLRRFAFCSLASSDAL